MEDLCTLPAAGGRAICAAAIAGPLGRHSSAAAGSRPYRFRLLRRLGLHLFLGLFRNGVLLHHRYNNTTYGRRRSWSGLVSQTDI